MGDGHRESQARSGRRLVALLAATALAAGVAGTLAADAIAKSGTWRPAERAKNVIVMISDGWGYNHIAATDYYQHGRAGWQVYERFPVRKAMSTYSTDGWGYNPLQAWGLFDYMMKEATDSASAATAMSTGIKTYDSAIGVDVNKQPLYHVAQEAEKRGKATGVVTTVEWSHATPAGFVAHNISRNDYVGIAKEMITSSATDVIMGAGSPLFDDNGVARTPDESKGHYKYVGGADTWNALVAGTAGGDADGDGDADAWKLIQTKAQFEALARAKFTPARVCGTAQAATTLQQGRGGDGMAPPYVAPFNTNVPDLEVMTKGALNVLDNDRNGFFLMVEGGAVDWAGHGKQPGRLIEEQIDFNDAVDAAVAWVNRNSNWGETLLIVTGDHETGYLWGPGTGAHADGTGNWLPVVNNGRGVQPGMQFNSGDHTNSLVPFYARGSAAGQLRASATGSDPVRGTYLDNTAIAKVIFQTMR